MEIKVNFLDKLRLEAKFDDFTVIADQPIRYKGDGSAPGPFDRFLAIRNADVDVQSENQVCSRDLLHVFHDRCVTLVFGDGLILPMGEGMRAGARDAQAFRFQQLGEREPHLPQLVAGDDRSR